MDTFEVCISRIISSFTQCLESCLHQCTYTTAENCLLTKEVCLCFCTVSCLQQTCSCSTDSKTISQCFVPCFSGVILLYSDQTWCSFSCLVLASYSMSRSFWSDHSYINICRRFDASEMNVETMCEHQHIAFIQVWFNVFFVHICLQLIVDQNHNDVCLFCSFCCCIYF